MSCIFNSLAWEEVGRKKSEKLIGTGIGIVRSEETHVVGGGTHVDMHHAYMYISM